MKIVKLISSIKRPFKLLRFRRSNRTKGLDAFKRHLDNLFVKDGLDLKSTNSTAERIEAIVGLLGIAVILVREALNKEDKIEIPLPNFSISAERTQERSAEQPTSTSTKFSHMIGTSFDMYAPKLKKLEGGYANVKGDRGGATNMGVTLKTFRRFFGSDKTVNDLKAMTEEQWKKVMISYWNTCRADEMVNQSVAELIVDWAINSGPVTAIKKVQRILGVAEDGVVGTDTLDALNNESQSWLFEEIKQARINFYQEIVRRDPTQQKFLAGWLKRVNSFEFVDQDTSFLLAKSSSKHESTSVFGSGNVNRR